jgi:hypothetical protein
MVQKMKHTAMVVFKVVGKRTSTGEIFRGVFAKRNIEKDQLIHGTEYVGKCSKPDKNVALQFHMRQLRAPQHKLQAESDDETEDTVSKKCVDVYCDASNTLHTGHLGGYINTHIDCKELTPNVRAPSSWGGAHMAIRAISKGEELLVSVCVCVEVCICRAISRDIMTYIVL